MNNFKDNPPNLNNILQEIFADIEKWYTTIEQDKREKPAMYQEFKEKFWKNIDGATLKESLSEAKKLASSLLKIKLETYPADQQPNKETFNKMTTSLSEELVIKSLIKIACLQNIKGKA